MKKFYNPKTKNIEFHELTVLSNIINGITKIVIVTGYESQYYEECFKNSKNIILVNIRY